MENINIEFEFVIVFYHGLGVCHFQVSQFEITIQNINPTLDIKPIHQ